MCDGNPLPSFEGEPKLVEIPTTWMRLRKMPGTASECENKGILFVRYIDIATEIMKQKS